ncbi:O-methyltransferase [Dichotomicrobium thermohalophilum]|uniref:Putative O-methyltransferase YrrM n=1 Tax=Dichotomicrobium thermohalophilum TaxID=933063 RepID=A0A397Q6Z7_9HYPH|nr:O-methyltransferase [Dichotomicrobium thermohalophilum]RIA56249.1 putative O-methyltransferase YrrM [Dichotomicrobium thermohalophilum]
MPDYQMFKDVDAYIADHFIVDDPALDAAEAAAESAGLPNIAVSPVLGKYLYLLAKLMGARRILEIGTLGGYSTTWLARALPEDGHVVTLEYEPKHAGVARANLDRAAVGPWVEIIVGEAVASLRELEERGEPPFDMVFIDADKENYVNYLDWSIKLCRPGALIIADNVVRDGRVLDPTSNDPRVQGVQAFNDALAKNPRVEAIVTQMVGQKGYDGIALARLRE